MKLKERVEKIEDQLRLPYAYLNEEMKSYIKAVAVRELGLWLEGTESGVSMVSALAEELGYEWKERKEVSSHWVKKKGKKK